MSDNENETLDDSWNMKKWAKFEKLWENLLEPLEFLPIIAYLSF